MKRLMMLLVLLSGTAIAQDDPPDAPEKRLQEAWYMEVANGRYEEALAIYEELLARPDLPLITRVQTRLRKAQTLKRLGRIEESRAIAEEIVRRYSLPTDPADLESLRRRAGDLRLSVEAKKLLLARNEKQVTQDHPLIAALRQKLAEASAEYQQVAHLVLSTNEQSELARLVEAAQQELLGEDAEQATLHRKIESLIARLDSEDEATRVGAISALKRIGPEVIPLALEALRSGDYYTCEGAANVLVHYAHEDEAHRAVVLTALRQGDAIAQDALSRSFASQIHWPIPIFREMLADDSAQVRRTALELLENSRDLRNEREALYAALDDSAPEVRALAVRWLIQTASGEDPQPLKERLPAIVSDPDPAVCRTFAQFAHNHFPPELMPEMVTAAIPLLRSDDRETARWTVALMGRAIQPFWREGDDRLLPRMTADQSGRLLDGLEHLLRTAGPDQRTGAVYALLIVENDRSRDLLFRSLEDPEDKVAEAAASALGKRLDEERVVKRMVEALDDPRLVDRVTRELQNNLERAAVKAAMLDRLFELPEDMLSRLVQRYPEESVQRTLKSLDAFDRASPRVQDQILVIIGNAQLESAAPTVIQALRSEDKKLVDRALWVVGRVPSPEFVAPVIELLKSEDQEILIKAIHAASYLRAPELVEPLGKLATESKETSARRDAIHELSRLEFPGRLPYAVRALTDEDGNVVNTAMNIINRSLSGRDSRPVIDLLLPLIGDIQSPGWNAVERVLRGGNASDAIALASELAEAPPWKQKRILDLLPKLENPEVLPMVRPLTESTDRDVRQSAEYVLLELGTFEDIRSLVDTSFGVNAIIAFGKAGDERAVPILLEQLQSSEGSRAALVVNALEPFARASFVPALIDNALSERPAWESFKRTIDGQERQWQELASVRTLVHYPAEEALAGLARILESDAREDVRAEVIETLTRFDEAPARQLILSQLDSDSATVRTKAIEALGTFLDADLLPMLVDLLRHRLPEVRQAAQQSIEKIRFYLDQKRYAEGVVNGTPTGEAGELVRMLEHEEAAVRMAAAQALGRLHDPATLPALLKARKDRDENVRKAVEAALDMFTD
ncbi:MAG: HEAT repeat domain-containing protein [Planctomycetota bacterium]